MKARHSLRHCLLTAAAFIAAPLLHAATLNVPADHATIQAAIDAATAGDTISIAAGTYNENITVSKQLSIVGVGSDPAGTVLTSAAGDTKIGVINLSASGLSDLAPVLVQDLRVQTTGLAGISVGRFTEATGTSVEYVKLDNVQVLGTNTSPSTEQERGLYVDLTSSLRHLVVEDCAFNNLTYGWYFQKQVSADTSTVQFVTVTNTTFNHNNHKGIYAEKLSDATFTGCTVADNGFDSSVLPSYFQAWSAGVDINLKAGSYANFTFDTCIITGNATDEAKEGVGLTVKARDDGSTYGAFPASADTVLVTDCTITGNERGVRFGEPGKDNATPTNVTMSNNTISGNVQSYSGSDGTLYGDVINQTAVTLVGLAPASAQVNVPAGGSIQATINAASPGDTVSVPAGSYTENLNLNKALALAGPNTGINAVTGTRSAEAVIQGQVSVTSDGVTIDGLEITNPASTIGVYTNGFGGLTVSNNIIHHVNSASTGSATGVYIREGASPVQDFVISGNHIRNIGSSSATVSVKGIYFGDSNGSSTASNILIEGNLIETVTVKSAAWEDGGKGAYGILLNYGVSSGGSADNVQILNNTITDIEGLWVHGIGLETNTTNTVVQGNEISDLRDNKTPSDGIGIFFEGNPSGASVVVSENILHSNMGWGLAIHSDDIANYDYSVDASANYWDSSDGPSGEGSGSGSTIGQNISYFSYYADEALTNLVGLFRVPADYATIQAAIAAASSGDVIEVAAGVFPETGQIVITKDLTITGAGIGASIVNPTANTGSSGDSRGWWLVATGVTLNLADLTLDGTGYDVYQGIRMKGGGSIERVEFTEIKFPGYGGVGIAAFGDLNLDVTDSTFSEMGRIGVLYYGTGITASSFTGNTYTGKGDGDWLDYCLDISAGAVVHVENNTISNCTGVASSDGSTSAGVMVTTYFGAGTTATVTGNTISGCTSAVTIGYDGSDTSTAIIEGNNLAGNDYGVSSTIPVDASANYWGSTDGPGAPGASAPGSQVSYSSYYADAGLTTLLQMDLSVDDDYTAATPGWGITHFATLVEGIAAAGADSTVTVAEGTYPDEQATIARPDITIQGAGDSLTIVKTAGAVPAITVTADGATIADLGITNDVDLAEGVRIEGATDGLILDGLAITNLGAAGNAFGVHITNSFSNLMVTNCQIVGGRQGVASRVMAVYAPAGNTLSNIEVRDSEISYHFTGVDIRAQVDGLTITGNTFGPQEIEDCTAAVAGVYIGDGRDETFDLDNVVISNNSFTDFGRGVYVWNYTPTAELRSFEISGNTFAESIYSSPVRIMTVDPWGGTNPIGAHVPIEGPLTIDGNTFTQTAQIDGGSGVRMIDIRPGVASATGQVAVTNNDISFVGPFTLPLHGIGFRGPVTNATVTGNTLDGNNAGGSDVDAPSTTGVLINSDYGYFGPIASTASVVVQNNSITGFENGVTVYDAVNAVGGGLPTGASVRIEDNSITGNTTGILGGATGDPLDAAPNWWGAADGPSGQGPGSGDPVTTGALYSPWWADAAMTTLAYDNGNFDSDYTVERGETLEIPLTLTISGGTFTVDGGTLIAGNVDLQNGAVLNVVDGQLTIGDSTLAGSFTFFNSMGSVDFNGDVAISGGAEGLILVCDVHVADGATITVDGTLVIDGCVVDSDGSYSVVVNSGASFTMARSVMVNAAVSLSADDSKLYDNRFAASTIDVTSGTTAAQVYHNILDNQADLSDAGTGTVTSVDGWANLTDPALTENNLVLDLDITGLVDRTDDAGDVYIQPADVFTGTIDVSDLQQEITAAEMLLGYSTDFLTASSLSPGTNWNSPIIEIADTSTVIGKLDAAIGVSLPYPEPNGTIDDQTVASVTLTAKALEGETMFFQRVKLASDSFGGDTRLTTGPPTPAFLAPFTANSGTVTIDGSAPTIDEASVDGTQVQASSAAPVDVLDPAPAPPPAQTFRNGNPVILTFTATDAGPAGIDISDLDNDLVLAATNGTTTLDSSNYMVTATEDAAGLVSFTLTLDIPATATNGTYAVAATLLDRSGNLSATADLGEFLIANELLVNVELEDFTGGPRDVTFVATDAAGTVLASWLKTVEFTAAIGSVGLENVPATTANISAKTDWNLRSKVAATFTPEGIGSADLTAADLLPGGDITGDNVVNTLDYSVMGYHWLTTDPTADINGDGQVQTIDFLLLKGNFYTAGDAQ